MLRRALMVMLASVLGVGAAACNAKDEAAETAAESVTILGQQDVADVRLTQLNAGAVLRGSLQPAWVVNVKAQVPGTVADINADRGVSVRAGQVLATIRAEGIRSQAAGARAGVAAAQANVAVAEQRMESARTLRQAGAMSEIDFKAAAAGYEAARAQLAAARAAAAGAGEAEGHATVRAPITGVIAARSIEVGEAVNPGQPMFTVVRSDYLELYGQVPVEQATLIRPGQTVVFTLDAYPGREFKGAVARVEPMANPDTRQVGVYVRLRNPGGLLGGQFATGRIQTNTVAEALVVPQSAVRGADANATVLVVENGRAVKRPVTLGAVDQSAGVVQVKSGLRAGEIVIAAPGSLITEGARVQIGNAATPQPASKE